MKWLSDTCCIDDDGTDENSIIVTKLCEIRFVSDFTTTMLRHSYNTF